MTVHIACPSCQLVLAVEETARGTVVACSQCGKKMRVPQGESPPARKPDFQQAPPPLPQSGSAPEPGGITAEVLLVADERDRPRRHRSRSLEEDEDYRPVRKSKRTSRLGLWLGIGAGALTAVAVAVVVLVLLFNKSRPGEAGRQFERGGGVAFSYIPVPGWQIKAIPGLQFKVVVGQAENGFAPNVNFIPEQSPLPMAAYADGNIASLKAMFPKLRFLGKQPFNTNNGLQGFKLIHENPQGFLVLRQCQYMFGNGNQKIVITGSVPIHVGQRYDALLDACAGSFRFE